MVLFLDRVYGIENQSFLLHLLQVGFLPDLQAAVSLDTVSRENDILLPCSHASEIQCTIVGVTSDLSKLHPVTSEKYMKLYSVHHSK